MRGSRTMLHIGVVDRRDQNAAAAVSIELNVTYDLHVHSVNPPWPIQPQHVSPTGGKLIPIKI